jgi:uncharacterized protein YukE
MNKLTNLKSSPAKNAVTLTDVYLRAALGPRGGLRADDPAPPREPEKKIELDYPNISAQPEYAVEADKLNRFAREGEEAQAKLASLYKRLSQAGTAVNLTDMEVDAITRAESMLAGEVAASVQTTLHQEIQATNKLADALRNAIEAQHGVLRRVNHELSRAAGRRYAEEHKKLVKRLMAAADELHAANRAEQNFRNDLVRLGYDGTSLPPMNLRSVEDPSDTNGNLTYYWYQEAQKYSKSPEELAAGVRKARLAAALS